MFPAQRQLVRGRDQPPAGHDARRGGIPAVVYAERHNGTGLQGRELRVTSVYDHGLYARQGCQT